MNLQDCNLFIITGHYGSGKSEFALNLAYYLRSSGRACNLVDLDIVNPYFRSREMRAELEQQGIRVIASSTADGADIPALSPEISGIFSADDTVSVVDMGGDPVGARVLSRFAHQINPALTQMWMVVNANRPQTNEPQQVLTFIRQIEGASRCTVTGLVNNTHLCDQTQTEDVVRGNTLCIEAAQATGIPLVCNLATKAVADRLPQALPGGVFPLDLRLKRPWE